MGFTTNEIIKRADKVLAANVVDGAEGSAWYEVRQSFEFVSDPSKIYLDFNEIRNNPAIDIATARSLSTGTLDGIVQDLSALSGAIKLVEIPGTNISTYRSFINQDFTSGALGDWVQPQYAPRPNNNNAPSNGYQIRLFDGDPNTSGSEIFITDGTTGTGASKSVGWTFNYGMGMLFLSNDFKSTLTHPDLFIAGFRYIGRTINDIDGASGYADKAASYIVAGATSSLSNERFLSSSLGIVTVDNGGNGSFEVNIDDGVVPLLTSSNTFTSPNIFTGGISGSHTHLNDGTSYLVGGDNIGITTQSNGSVKIDYTPGSSPPPESTVNFADFEIPTGVMNGTNAIFTVANKPSPSSSLQVVLRGSSLFNGYDYIVSGSTIEFLTASGANVPKSGNAFFSHYRY